jgi:Na+-transporting NADH:ubiquinone oxidoreductase subunit NqrE
MVILFIFIIGIVEEIISMSYYKFAQKSNKMACFFLQLIRTLIWYYVISTIFDGRSHSFLLVMSYALGAGIGDYYALKWEPFIEEKIAKIKRKRGRNKKWEKMFKSIMGKFDI